MTETPVWVDGAPDGRIDPADRGLTLGDGVFDTLVAFNRLPFSGNAHLRRLAGQAEAIGIAVNEERVRAGWRDVLTRAAWQHLIVRTTVTRGMSARGLWPASPPRPTLVVSAAPWSAVLFAKPVDLVTSSIRRNPTSPAARLKTLNYLDNVLAAREAAEAGAGDALMLNTDGRVACTTIANIFALHGARLTTPPIAEGAQPGVMRALVLDLASAIGLDAAEGILSVDDLRRADAVFLTNSVRFLCGVAALDAVPLRRIAIATPDRLLAAVAERVREECGFDPRLG